MSAPKRPEEEAGTGPRRLALETLAQLLARRVPLDDVFDPLRAASGLDERDAALARAICMTTLRRLGTLDQAVSARLKRPVTDDRLRLLLASGAAQILFLDIPDHAAVDTAVRLARSERRLAAAAGLVNAVLRRIARDGASIREKADALADLPDWLAESWVAQYGKARARAIALSFREPASVDVTVKSDPRGWANRLGGALLPTGSVRLPERAEIRALEGFAEGEWWVQDAAAALPARLLAPKPGMRIADLCAAPGGKTAQLALAGAQVVAVDRSARRLERLSENLARLGLSAETRAMPAEAVEDGPYDAILLDAPCAATGTLRRHPEIAWIRSRADVEKLAAAQARLLDKAAGLLRPGGTLVYCTCSLELEEGEDQARAFLERRPDFLRIPVEPAEIGGLDECVTQEGDLRALPHLMPAQDGARAGMDGFFAARFRRQ